MLNVYSQVMVLFGWLCHLQEGTVSIVKVVSPGVNYLPEGNLRMSEGGGSGFTGTIQVDADGAVRGHHISSHGSGFNPESHAVWISYNGTDVDMVMVCVSIQFCVFFFYTEYLLV